MKKLEYEYLQAHNLLAQAREAMITYLQDVVRENDNEAVDFEKSVGSGIAEHYETWSIWGDEETGEFNIYDENLNEVCRLGDCEWSELVEITDAVSNSRTVKTMLNK